MNNNSTPKVIRNFVKKLSYSKKTAIAFIAILLIVCGNATAQNTDLPNPCSKLKAYVPNPVVVMANINFISLPINFNGITRNTVELNISTLQAGTYDVKINTGDNNNIQNKM